jgi:hypothetical protein
MNIGMANISILRSQLEYEGDETTLFKMNNCTFIKTNSHRLPKNIRNGIIANNFTDLTDKIYVPYMQTEHGLSKKEVLSLDVCNGITKVGGKDFYVFDKEFVKKVKNKVLYVLAPDECVHCYRKGQIEGFIQVNKRKFLTWY